MTKSRIGCVNCKRKSFLASAEEQELLHRSGRARTFKKYASTIETKIVEATRISVLHPCSDNCFLEIKSLRAGRLRWKKEEVSKRKIMLKNAERNLEIAELKLGEAILLHGINSDVAIRAKIKRDHYASLVGQRRRRLNELLKA